MNRGLPHLQPYPFERLERLLAGSRPKSTAPAISLGMGEPRDPTPVFIRQALTEHAHLMNRYPATAGTNALREAVAGWLARRYRLPTGTIDPGSQILPVNGTREALFALAQTIISGRRAAIAMPNPFYQIYEGAALLTGAEPIQILADPVNGMPDLDAVRSESVWNRIQIFYLTTPANPTGGIADREYFRRLLELSERYGFIVAADECYADIYPDGGEPPPGLIQACLESGRSGLENCIAFHSLSKRSSAPGLRSGFVVGDTGLIHAFLRYRTYQGCAMPLHVQEASRTAWTDDAHAAIARSAYTERLQAVIGILDDVLEETTMPHGGFYLWPRTPIPDTEFARGLWEEEHVMVLPGRFLSRGRDGVDPGANRIRMALVQDLETCVEAAQRIKRFVQASC